MELFGTVKEVKLQKLGGKNLLLVTLLVEDTEMIFPVEKETIDEIDLGETMGFEVSSVPLSVYKKRFANKLEQLTQDTINKEANDEEVEDSDEYYYNLYDVDPEIKLGDSEIPEIQDQMDNVTEKDYTTGTAKQVNFEQDDEPVIKTVQQPAKQQKEVKTYDEASEKQKMILNLGMLGSKVSDNGSE